MTEKKRVIGTSIITTNGSCLFMVQRLNSHFYYRYVIGSKIYDNGLKSSMSLFLILELGLHIQLKTP